MPNQDLINYINQAKAEGISNQKIKEDLLKVGWNQADIDEAFANKPDVAMAQITSSSNPATYQKTPIVKITIITISAILLISSAAGAFYYADKQFNWGFVTSKKITDNTNLSIATSTPKTIIDEIANWQIYKNEQHKFEIRYPSDWKVFENPIFSGPIFVAKNYDEKKIKNGNVDEENDCLFSVNTLDYNSSWVCKNNKGEETIGDNKFTKCQFGSLNNPELKTSYMIYGSNFGYIYKFDFNERDELCKMKGEKMLSTLKFTK